MAGPRFKNLKSSWGLIATLISLQFKAGIRIQHGKKPIQTAVKVGSVILFGAILLGVLVAVYYLVAKQFMTQKGLQSDLRHEFLVFTILAFMILQTLFLIPMLMKTLDINNDREMLLKLPVSSNQIFTSKIVVAYLYEIVFAAVILFPILIAYGFASGMSVGFFFLIPVVLVFVPVAPFCLAILVLFPVMKVAEFMRNRSQMTTITYLAGLVALIVGYMYLINGVVYAIADNGFSGALEKNAASFKNTAKFMYPPKLFANLFDTTPLTAGWSFAAIILVSVALMTVAYYVAGAKYKKFYQTERVSYPKPSKHIGLKSQKPGTAVLGKDIKNIFRSSNYTFQFLLIIAITPLLVYFCTRIAGYAVNTSLSDAGQIDSSQQMIFSLCLFIIMVLIPLACSFAASNISREGWNIYHTKLIPIPYKKQLLIKTMIVFIPLLVSLAVSCGLMALKNNISTGNTLRGLGFGEIMTVFAISVFLSIGYICLGTYLDLRKPVCNQVGAGELNKGTAHTNFIMVMGIIIGVAFGFFSMFTSFAGDFGVHFSLTAFKIFTVCISFAFAVGAACLLFLNGSKRYRKLEQ